MAAQERVMLSEKQAQRLSIIKRVLDRQLTQALAAQHNRRFALVPLQAQDAHRACRGTHEALARICSVHHQRQLSAQLSCQFEGCQIWLTPGPAYAPKGAAKVDIAEHGDGRLELLYRGQVLQFKAHVVHEHLQRKKRADEKTLNQRVDAIATQQRKLRKLPCKTICVNTASTTWIRISARRRWGQRTPAPALNCAQQDRPIRGKAFPLAPFTGWTMDKACLAHSLTAAPRHTPFCRLKIL